MSKITENIPIYLNDKAELEDRVEDLLNRLTTEEKTLLLAGKDFWHTEPIPRLKIPSYGMTDGPIGVAWHSSRLKNTRFPTSIQLASTWDRSLAEKFGIALGKETRASNMQMILAPGINIQRTPLNGRTFEYLTEDPYLNKELTIPLVKGVQSQRISVCVKHYVANNQETKRMKINAIIDERTLHEIYLRAFEQVVKEADPWSFMACYNKVNGYHGAENKQLLREILMDKWGFRGFVVSDWFATRGCKDTVSVLKGGLTLEMPKKIKYKPKLLQQALSEGRISEEDLDFAVKRLLRVMFLVGLFDKEDKIPKGERNTKEHQLLARLMAEDGCVLLKNENDILPIDIKKISSIAIIGPNKNKKDGFYFYGGSSAVVPPYEITLLKGIKQYLKEKKEKGEIDKEIKIISDPSKADIVFLAIGLNHWFGNDAEGKDRKRYELPKKQIKLIKKTIQLNPNTVAILINGSPVSTKEWRDMVPAILEAWYPGMEGGPAVAKILFGDTTPSGKLPITFPEDLSQSPAHQSIESYPGVDLKVEYNEGIYVGYRHFDKNNIKPAFPFGFGLSYTTFDYTSAKLNKDIAKKEDDIIVSVSVKNTGKYKGKEIVQVYMKQLKPKVERPPKELVGFYKIELEPNEEKTIEIKIKVSDFAYWDINKHDWKVDQDNYKILIGKDSQNITHELDLTIQ